MIFLHLWLCHFHGWCRLFRWCLWDIACVLFSPWV